MTTSPHPAEHGLLRRLVAAASNAARLLEPAAADRIRHFLDASRNPDGGHGDRHGHSDLYYTYFALAANAALDIAPHPDTVAFITSFAAGRQLDFVHLVALSCGHALLADHGHQLPAAGETFMRLAEFRAGDGGYSRIPGAPSGTAYDSFLALLAGADPPPSVANFATDASPTPVLAAAMILHQVAGGMADAATIATMTGRQMASGGFRALPDSPAPDLLSTAVAVFALRTTGHPMRHSPTAFVTSLWNHDGGFAGAPDDPRGDVEYTFYALLSLGSMADTPRSP